MIAFTQVIIGRDHSAYVHFGSSGEVFSPLEVSEARDASRRCGASRVRWGGRDYDALAIHCPCSACRVTHAVNQTRKKEGGRHGLGMQQMQKTLPHQP